MNAKDLIKDALREVNKHYISFTVEYYSTFEPNAWQESHNMLERALASENSVLISNQITVFKSTLIRLTREYQTIRAKMQFNERIGDNQ